MVSIKWNGKIKLIISDVDETIADLYTPASQEVISELEKVLNKGIILFLISGQGLQSIKKRIVEQISPKLRKQILVSHCNGSEVLGFDKEGIILKKPYYSLYDSSMSEVQKKKLREIVKQLIDEFKLEIFSTMPITDFLKKTVNPLAVMFEDRGPQITFEVVNGYDLTSEQVKELEIKIPETNGNFDLRIPILEKAEQLFKKENLPLRATLGGVFALDFVIKGVSKTTAVDYILENKSILKELKLNNDLLNNPDSIEVWGDKFSIIRGGTDRHISEALPKEVRSIDFRKENPEEFPEGYNIVIWEGKKQLHEGLLEYLKLSFS